MMTKEKPAARARIPARIWLGARQHLRFTHRHARRALQGISDGLP